MAAGLDTENIHEDTVMGVALSYADTAVDSKNANRTDTDIESYQITVYGDFDIDERSYISGSAGYVYGRNETVRYNVGGVAGLDAHGEFDSHQAVAHIEAGRRFTVRKGLVLTPHMSTRYVYYDADGYTETGAGGANLRVDNESLHILEPGIGIKAEWEHRTADGAAIKPELHAGYHYDLIGDKVQSTSSFTGGGASFKTEGADPAQSTFNAGAGLKLHTTDNWEFTASYDFKKKSDYKSHSGFFRTSYKF